MTGLERTELQEAFARVADAFWTMPYAGGIGLENITPPMHDDMTESITDRVNLIAHNLETLSKSLALNANRQEAINAEVDKFRRWHRTMAEIASSLGGAS